MLSVEKYSNFLGDRKEAVVPTPLLQKKLLTKDVDKCTGDFEDMKEAGVRISRKGLYKFEVHYKGSTRWFKFDSDFFKNLQFIQNSILKKLKRMLKVKRWNYIKLFSCRLIKNISRQKM